MVSIIIPALNEERAIAATLDTVLSAEGEFEILVVDGQSADATREIASRYCRTVCCPPGRARQMNFGAEKTCGEVLLFLHADVCFPASGILSLQRAMSDPRVAGGNFNLVYEGDYLASRTFTLINRWRRPFGIFYGDSGIFVRRSIFDALAGFRPLPLMEDYDFARRLVKAGKTVCLDDPLWVSARRWEEHGLLRTMSSWFLLQTLFSIGVPVRHLARCYPHIRRHL